jgi:hypothetical protein
VLRRMSWTDRSSGGVHADTFATSVLGGGRALIDRDVTFFSVKTPKSTIAAYHDAIFDEGALCEAMGKQKTKSTVDTIPGARPPRRTCKDAAAVTTWNLELDPPSCLF